MKSPILPATRTLSRRRPAVVEPLEARIAPAAIFWDGAASGNWNVAANWSGDVVPGADDDVTINPAGDLTITIIDTRTVRSLTMPGDDNLAVAGGDLTIALNSTVHDLNLSAGAVRANGLLTLTGAGALSGNPSLFGAWRNEGVLATGGTPRIFPGAVFENAGSIVDTGSVNIIGSGKLRNLPGGTFDVAFAGNGSFVIGDGTFHNSGTLLRSAAGAADNQNVFLQNDSGGAFMLTAGSFALNTNGSLEGASFTVAAGTSVNFSGANGTELALSGALTGTGAGSVNFLSGNVRPNNASLNFAPGVLHWNGGNILGSLTNAGAMEVGGNPVLANGAVLDNSGSIVSKGTFSMPSGSALNNLASGTFDVAFVGDGSFISSSVGGGTFHNFGILKRSATGAANNNFGVVFENEPGGKIVLTAGSFALNTHGTLEGADFTVAAGSSVSFSGANGTELLLSGTLTGRGAGSVNFLGGNVRSDNAMLNFPAGLLHWTGGNILGTLNNAGAMSVDGTVVVPSGTVFNNSGSIVETGQIRLNGGGRLNNLESGTFDVAFVGDGSFAAASVNGGTFHNAGTLKRSAAGGANTNFSVVFENAASGKIVLTAGSFEFDTSGSWAGADFTVATGTAVNFSGANGPELAMTGTYTGSGGGTVSISSGLVRPNGATFDFPYGLFHLRGGNFLGPLNNDGFIAIDARANLAAGGELHNQAGGTITVGFSGSDQFLTGPGLLKNAGLLRHTGTGTASLPTVQLENLAGGIVEVQGGTFDFGSVKNLVGGTLTGGTWEVQAGATLSLPGTITTNAATLIVHGNGVVNGLGAALTANAGRLELREGADLTTTGNFTNSGSLVLSAGTAFTVGGAFSQSATGRTEFGIGGVGAANIGRVVSTAPAQLNGTAVFALDNGFGPLVGQQFTVASFPSHTGEFAQIEGLFGTGRQQLFSVATSATAVVATALVTTADLDVTSVSPVAGGLAGQSVTINYTVTNIAAADTFTAGWFDSIYLSRDGVVDPADALLGRFERTAGLAGGASYNGSVTAELPGVLPGTYQVLVLADSRGLTPDSNRTNNLQAGSQPLALSITALTPGVAVSGTIAPGDDVYFRIDLPAGQTPVFSANYGVNGAAELYVGQLFIPGPDGYDLAQFSFDSNQAEVTGFAPIAGTYYVHLVGRENAGAGTIFTLSADSLGFGISRVDQDRGANVGLLTMTVRGSLFRPDTAFSLALDRGASIAAQRVYFENSATAHVTFDLTGLPLGDYDVRATQGAATDTLPDALSVIAGTAGELKFDMSAPRYIRPNFGVAVTLTYENTGGTDLIAPIITLTGENGRFNLAGEQGGNEGTIELLAINPNGPAGILPPGARGTLEVFFEPIVAFAHAYVYFTGRVAGLDGQPIDWSLLKGDLRPASVPADAWDAIFANFVAELGTTFAEYQSVLSENATYLGQLGHRTADVGELITYELLQASDFGSITERYHLGSLGRGPEAPFDGRAITAPPSHALDPNFVPREGERTILRNPDGSIGLIFTKSRYPSANGGGASSGGSSGGRVGSGPPPAPIPGLDDLAGVEGNVTIQVGDSVRSFISIGDGVSRNVGQFIGVAGETGTLRRLTSGALKLTEQDGSVTMFRASDGRIDYAEDATGFRTTAGYDGQGRLLTLTETDGDITGFTYNGQGRLTRISDAVGRDTTFTYDASGEHLLSQTSPAGTTSFTYFTGQGAAREHALESVTFSNGTQISYTYDAQGRLATQQLNGGALATRYSYDSVGTVTETNGLGQTTSIFRDSNANVARFVDALGRTSATRFDEAGRPISTTGPGGANFVIYNNDGTITRLYDAAGQAIDLEYEGTLKLVSALTNTRGFRTEFGHDAEGNVVSVTDDVGSEVRYGYDGLGRLTQSINARGQTITYTLDAAGDVIFKDLPGTANDVIYTYDVRRNVNTVSSPADGTTDYDFDTAGRLTKATYPDGKFVAYTYNADGERTSMSDGSGFSVSYAYDALGRLDTVKDWNGATLEDYDYDTLGHLALEKHGNGATTSYGYDPIGRVTAITHRAPDGLTVLEGFTYTYDSAGHVATQTSSVSGSTTYGYDALGQLTSVALAGGRTIIYAYDSEGNRTLLSDSAAGATAYAAANGANQYSTVGGATYSYDADGNLVARTGGAQGSASYTYDPEGRLIAAITPDGAFAYDYDAAGNRIAMTRDGVRTSYLVDATGLGNVFAEYGATGALTAHYAQGLGLASRVDASGQAAFYHYDLTGNTQLLTGTAGAVVGSYEYLPFGEKVGATGNLGNAFTFNGRYGVQENGAGLYDMRARAYDPELGRFLQEDMIGFRGGDTNLYRYASNSPIERVDPAGETDYYAGGTFDFITPIAGVYAGLAGFVSSDGDSGFAISYGTGIGASAGPSGALGYTSDVGGYGRSYEAALPVVGYGATTDGKGNVTGEALQTKGLGFSTKEGNTIKITVTSQGFRDTLNEQFRLNPNVDGAITDRSGLNNSRLHSDNRRALQDPIVAAVAADLIAAGDDPVTALETARRLVKNYRDHPDDRRTGSEVILPKDPNNIIGPNGIGADPIPDVPEPDQMRFDGFVKADGNYGYTIQFENQPSASAPAQVVTVMQTLDADLDFSTFELGSFAFGNIRVEVPTARSSYHTVVDLTDEQGILVDISAALNVLTGVVTWTFISLDPATGDLPLDPFAGFLPPNVTVPQGDGQVTYSIQPKAGFTGPTRVDARASIVFDTEEAILTPAVHNIIDGLAPASSVAPFAATTVYRAFNVGFAGADEAGGSGLQGINVYYRDNGGPLQLLVSEAPASGGVPFRIGQVGHTYTFFTAATDRVGNAEVVSATPDATITVAAPAGIAAPGNKKTLIDSDGDSYTIQLTGPGTLSYLALDPDGAGPLDGPLDFLIAEGTTAKSKLSVTVKRKADGPDADKLPDGDGIVTIGDVQVTGALASFTAKSSDLNVNGFTATGAVKSIIVRDLLDPDAVLFDPLIQTGGGATDKLAVTARNLTDHFRIETTGQLGALKTADIGNGTITAAAIASINASVGGIDADIASAGAVGTITAKTSASGDWAGTKFGAIAVKGGSLSADIISGGIVGKIAVTGAGYSGNLTAAGAVAGLSVKGGGIAGNLMASSFGGISTDGGGLAGNVTATGTPALLLAKPGIASIAVKGGDLNANITAAAAIGAITATNGSIAGNFAATKFGAVKVSGGALAADFLTPGAIRSVTVSGGAVSGDLTAGSFGAVAITGGNFTGTLTSTETTAVLKSKAAIASFTLTGGDFAGDIRARGALGGVTAKLKASIGGNVLAGSTISAAKIGAINVAGNVTGALILAGADLGNDFALGGSGAALDAFAGGSIASLKVGGSILTTTFAAGLDPVDGIINNANDLFPAAATSLFGAITVTGTVDAASHFGAGDFKAAIRIGGVLTTPTPPRFQEG